MAATLMTACLRALGTLVARCLPLCMLIAACCSACVAQQTEISGRIHSSGLARYVPERWSTVKGIVSNPADEAQSVLMVVTPPGGQNLQYARHITLPPQTYYETQWPVLIPAEAKSGDDFRTLVFPGGEDDGVIRRRSTDVGVASFSAVVRPAGRGLTAWFAKPEEPPHVHKGVNALLQMMRFVGYGDNAVTSIQPRDYMHFSEALDSLNQLCITTDELKEYPNLQEAIRLWVQRGGRLMLMVDQTGTETATLLLGDALPLTVVGETSSNRVQLDLNPMYSERSYPQREVVREFQEPVRWLRVLAEAGEFIWTVEGWPVAIRLPFGRGQVLVTTIDAAVFTVEQPQPPGGNRPSVNPRATPPPFDMIPSSRRMIDALLQPPDPLLVDAATVLQTSTNQIGYSIPGRWVAAALALSFPAALLIAGVWVQRRRTGERLIWLVPALSVAISAPIVVAGVMSRSVAPPTILETCAIQSIEGQTQLVSDGFAVSYTPESGEVEVRSVDGAVVDSPVESENADIRRLKWTSADDCEWVNVNQSSGIRQLPIRGVKLTGRPLKAVATFDSDGAIGTFDTAEFSDAADAIFAGAAGTRMSVQWVGDKQFRIKAGDVLRPQLFIRDALMSEAQQVRTKLYESLFANTERLASFPEQPSLLTWFDDPNSAIVIGSEAARRERSVLLVQPLQLQAPQPDQLVTIPAGFLDRRAIADSSGSVSTVYNNARHTWLERESAGSTLLEFLLPSVCLPFELETAELQFRIRAGSRQLQLFSGTPERLEPVTTLDSPVGSFDVQLPVQTIAASARAGRFCLQLQVSDLDAALQNTEAVGEQDDSWQIESLEVTLTGRRRVDQPGVPATIDGPAASAR
jgi:hypothetical protein